MFVIDVEGAVERDGRYLMIVRGLNESESPGALGFPGGKVEPTDDPKNTLESAVRREILEEVGAEVHPEITYVESGLFDMDDGRRAMFVIFLCQYKSGAPRPDSGGEVESVQWMTPEQVRREGPPWLGESIQMVEKVRRRVGGQE